MRVKVGDTWYDSTEQPICLQLNELEKEQIANMGPPTANNGKYAVFPDVNALSREEMLEWMKEDGEK